MDAGRARAAATDWVEHHAHGLPGFRGAYLVGSAAGLPAHAPVPVGSDLDVMVVLDPVRHGDPGPKPGKLRHDGVLLDVTVVPSTRYDDLDAVLSDYHLAAGLKQHFVVSDETGWLRTLQSRVGQRYADPHWVRRRLDDVEARIRANLTPPSDDVSWPDRVLRWVFGTGQVAHLVLVGALRNPTVRRRYTVVKEVVDRENDCEVYADLLRLLGSEHWTPAVARRHLGPTAAVFDTATSYPAGDVVWATDLTPSARPIAVDGSRAMVDDGQHRDVAFWLAVTQARCHTVLWAAAPEAAAPHRAAFADLLGDLGVRDDRDLRARAEASLAAVPRIRAYAESVR